MRSLDAMNRTKLNAGCAPCSATSGPNGRSRAANRAAAVLFGCLLAIFGTQRDLRADDVAAAAPSAKPAAESKLDKPTAPKPADPEKKKDVTPAEQLEFLQAKVAAEMTELEERMFRLAETLKKLEPENSSRLMLGLKFAREELILHQMQEIQAQLHKLSLAESVIDQKELLTKLGRLEELLLSADLDFQMRLERLRQIREILRKLDTAIREEDREQKLSVEIARQEQRLAELEKRAAALAELIERQTAHLARNEEMAKHDPEAGEQADLAELSREQSITHDRAAELAGPAADKPAPPADKTSGDKASGDKVPSDKVPDDKARAEDASAAGGDTASAKSEARAADLDKPAAEGATPAEGRNKPTTGESAAPATDPVGRAAKQMAAAVEKLDARLPSEAQPPMKQALDSLQAALAATQKEQRDLQAVLDAQKFAAMAKDQSGNRQSTESIAEMVRGLGETGASALGELTKADGSMSDAERDLAARQPSPAGDEQRQALAALKSAREQLAAEAEKLQEQLRAEVKKRVLDGLVLMLEQQVMVRESTVLLGPRVAQGSRQAQASVVGLARSEGKIMALADELISLVEETEFGIALPAAMRVVRDEMEVVQTSLAKGDADARIVADERQVEADLQALMEAMKQMPAAGRGKPGKKGSPQERERELNRLIAELKLIRLLEQRVHKETVSTDQQRGEAAALPAGIRKLVEELGGRQEDVRDVMDRLAAERSPDSP
jgi:hypothetical protein